MNALLSIYVIRGARKRSRHLLRLAFALLVFGLAAGILIPSTTVAQGHDPAAEETLLDATIEHDLLPSEQGFVIFGRVTVEPGARHTTPERGEQGTIVIVVEAGRLTYQIEGVGRIIRGAGTDNPRDEIAPSGVPFTLATGDALVYPAQGRVEANERDERAVFLFALILAPIGPPESNPSDVGAMTQQQLGYVEGVWPDLVSGPVTITLRRTLLEPGALLPAPTGGTRIVSQESGAPGALVAEPDGGMRNDGDAPIDLLILSIAPETGSASLAA
jgi:hypothetical protein